MKKPTPNTQDDGAASQENPWDSAKSSSNVRQFTVDSDDDGIRLDRWFKRHLPQIGFATVSRWARTGQLRVNGARAKPEDRLEEGQTLRVPPGGDEARSARSARPRRALCAEEIALAKSMVIRETASAIALNKPPGLATQGGSKTTRHVDGLLDAFIEDADDADSSSTDPATRPVTRPATRPRLVHRLDKDTSGVLLVAKTPGAAASYSKRFSGRSAKKVYWALVMGVPEVYEGSIDAPLAKQPGTGGEKMHVDLEQGQPAKTLYRVVDRAGDRAAWVELQPMTGRTHQLRVHMEAIGHPIVGDGKYGGKDAFLTGSISRKMHLHARRLIIEQPETGPNKGGNRGGGRGDIHGGGRGENFGENRGGKLDITAELPEHFAASMEQLGFDPAASDAAPDKGPEERSPATKKQAARQHAKQYRKSRRGERRSRSPDQAGKHGGKLGKKSGGRPASSAKTGAGKAGAGRSATGRSAGGQSGAGKSARTTGPAKGPRNGPRGGTTRGGSTGGGSTRGESTGGPRGGRRGSQGGPNRGNR